MFNEFCETQPLNLKTLAQRFQVVIRFHLGCPEPETRINSFTGACVFAQNWAIKVFF